MHMFYIFCILMDHKFNWFRYSWFLLFFFPVFIFFFALRLAHINTCRWWETQEKKNEEEEKEEEEADKIMMNNTWRFSLTPPIFLCWPFSPHSNDNSLTEQNSAHCVINVLQLSLNYLMVIVLLLLWRAHLPDSRLTVFKAFLPRAWE